MDKYIKLYLKRITFVALICAILVFLPLFLVSLIYDVLSYDLLVSFAPFFIGFVCVAVSALTIPRFKKMVAQQEKRYHAVFSDEGAQHLETTLYLSKDWLIWAGVSAIHREHIRSVRHRSVNSRSGPSNKVTIRTADNKTYMIWCLSADNIRKIHQWWES